LTGNLKQGGDWVMENTKEDVESVYFNDGIEYYQYLLDAKYKVLSFRSTGSLDSWLVNNLTKYTSQNGYSHASFIDANGGQENNQIVNLGTGKFFFNRAEYSTVYISPNGAILFNNDKATYNINPTTLYPIGIYALLSDFLSSTNQYVKYKLNLETQTLEIVYNTSIINAPDTRAIIIVTLNLSNHSEPNKIVIDYIDVFSNETLVSSGLVVSPSVYNAQLVKNIPNLFTFPIKEHTYISDSNSLLAPLSKIALENRRIIFSPVLPVMSVKETPPLDVEYSSSTLLNERKVKAITDTNVNVSEMYISDPITLTYMGITYNGNNQGTINFIKMPENSTSLKFKILLGSNNQFSERTVEFTINGSTVRSEWLIQNIPITIPSGFKITSTSVPRKFKIMNPTTDSDGLYTYTTTYTQDIVLTPSLDGSFYDIEILKFNSLNNVKITVTQLKSVNNFYKESTPFVVSLKQTDFPNMLFLPNAAFDYDKFKNNTSCEIYFKDFITSLSLGSYSFSDITLDSSLGTFDKSKGLLIMKDLIGTFNVNFSFNQAAYGQYDSVSSVVVELPSAFFSNIKNIPNSMNDIVISSVSISNVIEMPYPVTKTPVVGKTVIYSFVNESNLVKLGNTVVKLADILNNKLTIYSMRQEVDNIRIRVLEPAGGGNGHYLQAETIVQLNRNNFNSIRNLSTTLDISKLFPWETNSPEIDSVFVPLTVVTNSPGTLVFSSSRTDLASFNNSSEGVMKLTRKGHAVITVSQEATANHVAAPAQSRYFHTNQFNYITNICFPAGTPVLTDQGSFPIEELSAQTLHGKRIVYVTKTVSEDSHLVCFEKDSLGENLPSLRTLMTMNHGVEKDGNLVEAREFVNGDKVHLVPYEGEPLYNVLLENHSVMNVNGLVVETLDPTSKIAKFYA